MADGPTFTVAEDGVYSGCDNDHLVFLEAELYVTGGGDDFAFRFSVQVRSSDPVL